LIALTERPYETEDVLQALLADHPGLLAGDELAETPRRWVLLSREVGIADREGASGRWSLDHLFVDQDAIPTLVEVKRSSDTRIRREVVGQLLEYAANGTRYWPVEQLRALYEAGCAARDADPDAELRDVLGEDADVEAWWSQVESNLRLGRLRLVFVADVIGRELRRIIEFLNEQMTQTEVLGVEIRQYVDDTGLHQTLVPRLVGQTEAARDAKAGAGSGSMRRRSWNRESWFDAFSAEHHEDVAAVERLLEWAEDQHLSISFGTGNKEASMQFAYTHAGTRIALFRIFTDGPLIIPFGSLPVPFDRRDMRLALRERLHAIPDIEIAEERLDRYPNAPISALRDEQHLRTFTSTIEWLLDQVRRVGAESDAR